MLIVFASLMHLLWALMLGLHQSGLPIAATSVLSYLVPDYLWRMALYSIAALLPAVILRPHDKTNVALDILSVIPQQLLLICSGISAVVAITTGRYADGVMRSPLFIAADQGIYIVLAILYALESIDRIYEPD